MVRRSHAQDATRVAVALERIGKVLEISIDDNGVGFHFSGAFTLDELDLLRMGPVSLKRRARSLGADLTLESVPPCPPEVVKLYDRIWTNLLK